MVTALEGFSLHLHTMRKSRKLYKQTAVSEYLASSFVCFGLPKPSLSNFLLSHLLLWLKLPPRKKKMSAWPPRVGVQLASPNDSCVDVAVT